MFHDLYSSSKACAAYGKRREAFRVFVAIPDGNRPLGRNIRRREDNIKRYLKEIGLGGRGLN